jgi:hypothetical protein
MGAGPTQFTREPPAPSEAVCARENLLSDLERTGDPDPLERENTEFGE